MIRWIGKRAFFIEALVSKAWVDQWLHLAEASGEYDRTVNDRFE